MVPMPYSVDLIRVALCPRDHLERVRKRSSFHDERVVSHDLKWRGESGKNALAFMFHPGCLAAHNAVGTYDATSVSLADRRMSQAHPEHRYTATPAPNRLDGDSSLRRGARSRRDDDGRGLEGPN